MNRSRFCASCGAPLAPTAKFCPACGADQAQFRVDEPDATGGPAAAPPDEPAPPKPVEPAMGSDQAPAAEGREPARGDPPPPSERPEAVTGSGRPPGPGLERPEAVTAAPRTTPPPPGAATPPPDGERATAGAPAATPKASEPFAERVGRVDSAAGELAGALTAQLRVPGVVAAGLAAAIGAGLTLAAALVLAAIFPDDSLIGAVGEDAGVITETFRQVVQILLADVLAEDLLGRAGRLAPAVLALVPIAGCALGAASQASRTEQLAPRWRLAWGAATGIPFALLMLVAALAASGEGDIDPSVGGAFGLGLVWGALGGLIGAARAIGGLRSALPATSAEPRSPARNRLSVGLEVAGTALRPLGAGLVVAAVIGSGIWLYQTLDEVGNLQGERSEALALVENGLYAAEHGVHLTELGALVEFEGSVSVGALGLPIPVEDVEGLVQDGPEYRIFAYRDAMAAYVFIPLLVVAIALPVLLALYAGFAVARTRDVRTALLGAAWGAVVGPIWAIAMAILDSLTEKAVLGQAAGGSVFGAFLLLGSILGGLGGLLASRGQEAPPARNDTAVEGTATEK